MALVIAAAAMATVIVVVATALVIAAVQPIEVAVQIAAGARLESVLPVAVRRARAIDLAARQIAAPAPAEIASGVATCAAVQAGAPSATVPDTAREMRAAVATGVLKAWAVRVGASAERAAVAVVVALAQVVLAAAAVAVVAGSEVSPVIRLDRQTKTSKLNQSTCKSDLATGLNAPTSGCATQNFMLQQRNAAIL